MGPESGSHKVTITPNQWHVRRSSQAVDRSLTRPEAGGFSSQTVSTSTSLTFSQGVYLRRRTVSNSPALWTILLDLWNRRWFCDMPTCASEDLGRALRWRLGPLRQ